MSGIFSRGAALGGLLIAAAILAVPANAQNLARRTWVSGTGSNANPCTQEQPCQTLAQAASVTADGGEIDCASSGGFGVLTITRSLTIDCRGVVASILAAGADGIIVNAPGARVTLRGLTVSGGPPDSPGRYGIYVLAAGSVTLTDVVVENFAVAGGLGLVFSPSTAAVLAVSDSAFQGNGARSAGGGILIRPRGTGSANVTLDNVQVQRNGQVALAIDNLNAPGTANSLTVTRSDLSNSDYGVIALSNGGSIDTTIAQSRIASNAVSGIRSGGGATTVRVTDSVISGNTLGLESQSGGALISFGGNVVAGNGTNGAFTATAPKS